MAERIVFSVPLPPSGLRRNTTQIIGKRGKRSVHWGDKAKLTREYQEQVWCAGSRVSAWMHMPWERAKVHYTWRSTHQPDEDNIIASMKPALDVISSTGPRPLGIIVDDAGAAVSATWAKAAHKADECVEIEIVRLR